MVLVLSCYAKKGCPYISSLSPASSCNLSWEVFDQKEARRQQIFPGLAEDSKPRDFDIFMKDLGANKKKHQEKD